MKEIIFNDEETKKVVETMYQFCNSFVDFAIKENIDEEHVSLLMQGAMMGFAKFSCINPLDTALLCESVIELVQKKRCK